MNVFTFDDVYYFDRRPHDACWYAYTHPSSDPFVHGRFLVSTCEFESDSPKLNSFDESQKSEISRILKAHRNEMNLEQFEAHSVLPSHYREINRRSNRFADFIDRLKWSSRDDPTFAVAFETMTLRSPAYRLTRDFVSNVFEEMENVTPEEKAKWLDEVTRDSWTYDYDPAPNETYADFYRDRERKLTVPDSIKLNSLLIFSNSPVS